MSSINSATARIELAQKRHLAQIPKIQLAVARMFSAEDLPDRIRYRVTDTRTLRTASEESRLWVAINSQSQVVGFALADVIDEFAHLDELNVLPEYGGHGIGTQLVQTACAWARRNEYAGLSLVTFRHLPWNAPFYEKLGFIGLTKAELGAGLAALIDDESRAGIDTSKRIGMMLRFENQPAVEAHPQ